MKRNILRVMVIVAISIVLSYVCATDVATCEAASDMSLVPS